MSEPAITIEVTNEITQVAVIEGDTPSLEVVAPADIVVDVEHAGAQGIPGVGAEVHEESFTNANPWVVNHNFGRKPTSVQLLNVGGTELLADIVHTSDNQIQVVFVQPHTGLARVM